MSSFPREMSEPEAKMVKAMSKLLKKVPIRANKIDARTSDPVLNAKLGIASVDAGEIIEVITNDSSLDDVLPIWAKKTGHKYLGHVPVDGCEHLFMRRGA
ncbi:MAG: sulfurtransferase TusA family protein [Rhodospirillales bacterium]|jgi:TusA-related sulfurtransferase|nr:sulfurtransferase TusA family protein [Rhodospirillales bacterium]